MGKLTKPTFIGFLGMTHLGINSAVIAADKKNEVVCYDVCADTIEQLELGHTIYEEPLLDEKIQSNLSRLCFTNDVQKLSQCDLLYISADVETDDTGLSDLAAVNNYVEIAINAKKPGGIVVILSQVPPGFCRPFSKKNIEVFYQVETLIFGRAIERASEPERFIVGCADPSLPLPKTYSDFLELHGNPPIIKMKYESAELAKISINCMLVASISAANTLAELCESIGADWQEITPSLRLDKRIGKYSYINAGLGVAGGNLERDLATVVSLGQKHKCNTGVVQEWIRNSSYQKEWCNRILIDAVLPKNPTPKIGALGLSYKENTNSVKNSPAVTFLNAFKGFEISVYDPVVSDEIVPFAKHHTSMYSCLTGVDVLVILTAWNEFKSLTLSCLTGSMRGRSVIDPFGCLEHLNLSDGGFDYFRIGQSK